MSETILPAGEREGAKRISEAVIRIAGNSQDGIQSIGGFLARLAGRSEQDVMTFMTIPSTISGGPSIFQVRIGSGEVLSAGDDADVLLAFYQHSYQDHVDSLKEGGVVLYDSDHVEPKEEWLGKYHHAGVAITSLTVEAIGGTARDKGKNIFALGLIARAFGLNREKLEDLIRERFRSKPQSVTATALEAFQAGHSHDLGNLLDTYQFDRSEQRERDQLVMNGNESLAYGIIASGVRFGAGYPITPWSDIMELLRRELPRYGGTFVQCEDEIASISTALGASYGGRVAVTGSSGPGISLKCEALGWAVMAEVPLVVIDVQRGGPSTGMPTSVEQSDLYIACYGGHGDAPRVVLAASDVEDCFYTAIEAVNIARRCSVPVVILTDQAIATRIEAFDEPDLERLCQDISPSLEPVAEHKPYGLESGGRGRIPPGTRVESGIYPVITGLEHDEAGHPTASPRLHMAMTARRRDKLCRLAEELPVPEVYGPLEGEVLLVGWGSTRGPLRETVDRCRKEGRSVAAVHLRHLHPFPPGLEGVLDGYRRIMVVELNDRGLYGYGQLATLLRSRFCNPRIRSITKTDGLTFKVREIKSRMEAMLETSADE